MIFGFPTAGHEVTLHHEWMVMLPNSPQNETVLAYLNLNELNEALNIRPDVPVFFEAGTKFKVYNYAQNVRPVRANRFDGGWRNPEYSAQVRGTYASWRCTHSIKPEFRRRHPRIFFNVTDLLTCRGESYDSIYDRTFGADIHPV